MGAACSANFNQSSPDNECLFCVGLVCRACRSIGSVIGHHSESIYKWIYIQNEPGRSPMAAVIYEPDK